MTTIDEAKVKRLLHVIVDDMMSCFDPNIYNQGVKDTLHKRIDMANLLTDQPACATVKKQQQKGL